MRLSYDGLFARVKSILKKDPFSGHVFVFMNRSRTSCKALYYDSTGLVIVQKRLEKGLFSQINPRYPRELVLTESEFGIFFEGGNLEKRFVDTAVEIKKRTSRQLPFGRFHQKMKKDAVSRPQPNSEKNFSS